MLQSDENELLIPTPSKFAQARRLLQTSCTFPEYGSPTDPKTGQRLPRPALQPGREDRLLDPHIPRFRRYLPVAQHHLPPSSHEHAAPITMDLVAALEIGVRLPQRVQVLFYGCYAGQIYYSIARDFFWSGCVRVGRAVQSVRDISQRSYPLLLLITIVHSAS